jgi:2-polyprenyl-3-methyl-5-hydroxy-6-metoxy-1,4-benzoquinol methylase
MIIHRLIQHHFRRGYDTEFSLIQARDSIRWLKEEGVCFSQNAAVLDLGCGSGIFGQELRSLGCDVLFADDANWLAPGTPVKLFRQVNIDKDDLTQLGQFDLIVCSNVLEHLHAPERLIRAFGTLLKPGGKVYLSWTNWLSPWGGHDFSPFHYLGPRLGAQVFDKLLRRPRLLKPFENLFPTYIGETIKMVRSQPGLRVISVVPRYYTELRLLMRIPWVREFLAWNCAMLIGKEVH